MTVFRPTCQYHCEYAILLISEFFCIQAVLIASIKQNRRVLQRLHVPDVPPPGLYTTNRCCALLCGYSDQQSDAAKLHLSCQCLMTGTASLL